MIDMIDMIDIFLCAGVFIMRAGFRSPLLRLGTVPQKWDSLFITEHDQTL